MYKALEIYVRSIDSVTIQIGRVIKFAYLALLAVLVLEIVARFAFSKPQPWTLEIVQYILTAFFLIGGGYVFLVKGHIRMDAFFNRWTVKQRAIADVATFFLPAAFLVVLILGGIDSFLYALDVGQASRSQWRFPLAPIKIIMTGGAILLFLQIIAFFIKDLSIIMGKGVRGK